MLQSVSRLTGGFAGRSNSLWYTNARRRSKHLNFKVHYREATAKAARGIRRFFGTAAKMDYLLPGRCRQHTAKTSKHANDSARRFE